MIATGIELENRVFTEAEKIGMDPGTIRVSERDGVVTLDGRALAGQAWELCAALRRLPGVDEVVNRINIRDYEA